MPCTRVWPHRLARRAAVMAACCVAVGALTAAAMAQAPALTSPTSCGAAEFHQFDFWLGDWQVLGPRQRLLGTNRIATILGGCALREEWTSADGRIVGTSYSAYDPKSQRWHQAWFDNAPSQLRLVGGLIGRNMVLEQRTAGGASMPDDVQRITWAPLGDGRVRQHWERSRDGGQTWTTAFDGTYVKR